MAHDPRIFATYTVVSAEFRKREVTGWECVLHAFNRTRDYQCTGGGEFMAEALEHALQIAETRLGLRSAE